MATQVKVTSIDALESFRASLIVFLTKAHQSLDEVGDEVRRTRLWLQNDQRLHWEGELRRRRRTLDQAQQELLSARLAELRSTTSAQQTAVLKAKRAVADAEDKLRTVKLWNRDFESTSDPLLRKLQSLRFFLDHDMPKAIAYLMQAQKTLETYTMTPTPGTPTVPSTEPKTPE